MIAFAWPPKAPELKPLTVNEDDGDGSTMSAAATMFSDGRTIQFRMSVTEEGEITFRKFGLNDPMPNDLMKIPSIDIDSMILYLQEVKQFIDEAKTVRKLQGK